MADVRITDLTRSRALTGDELFVAATCLASSPTTQGVSACVILNYVLANSPYSFGANLSCVGWDDILLQPCFVVTNKAHYNIIPPNTPFDDDNTTQSA